MSRSVDDQQLSYRAHLLEAAQKSQDDYDKTLVALAGGTLALSLTFFEEIAGDDPTALLRLALGWGLLVASLLFILISFFTSRKALSHTIDRFDQGDLTPHRGCWTVTTECCNVIAGLLFLIGVALVLSFAFLNLRGSHEPRRTVVTQARFRERDQEGIHATPSAAP